MPTEIRARRGDVLVLVASRKGAFILHSEPARRHWKLYGPHCPGSDVFHLTYDGRNGGQLFAAVNSMWFGPQVEFSRDLGRSWEQPREQPRFSGNGQSQSHNDGADANPENAENRNGPTVNRLWHIEPGRTDEPETLYAGVEPAALFKSVDQGLTWQEIPSLSNHPTRPEWMPGFGGLCLHTIIVDDQKPDRMWVGISAVGIFRTEDGGASWQFANRGLRADFDPSNRFPEWGVCPHKALAHPAQPNLLYQQNHCGVFRSDNGGDTWQDITEGLPSRFGFVLGLHPRDPQTLYVLPEDQALGDDVGGGLRYVSGAQFRVFRSRNGGQSWQPLTKGLPQQNAYLHALREGMATDCLDPCGVYVGTTNGQIFYTRDEGDSWELLAEHLPPINSVEAALVV